MGLDLIRGRVGALIAVLFLSSCALGIQGLALPLYLQSIQVPRATIGLILGTFGAALVVFEFTWGWWSDRVGVGIPLIITRAGLAAMMLGYAFAHTSAWFFVLQFACGSVSCAMGPLPLSFLSHVIDPKRRGEAIALAQTPGPIGMGLGALIGGLVIQEAGYQITFFAAAGLAAVSAVVAYGFFRRVGPLGHDDGLIAAAGKAEPSRPAWIVPLVAVSLFAMLAWIGSSGERSFLPILARSRGLSPAQTGLLLTALSFTTAVLMLPLGRLGDRVGRLPVIIAGAGIGSLALAAYSVIGGFAGMLGIAAFRAIAGAATVPSAIALLATVTPPRVRGRVMGLYGSLEDIGIALGPTIGGLVWSALGIVAVFVVMAAFYSAAMITALGLFRESSWVRAGRLTRTPLPSP